MPQTAYAQTAQAWQCSDGEGYLFQYPANNSTETTIRLIDMVTGEETTGPVIDGRINGIGYNVQDDYIYGWDYTLPGIVRVGSNGVVEELGQPDGFPPSSGLAGDVDENGHYWVTGSIHNAPGWSRVNLATMELVDSGPIEGDGIDDHTAGPDWAYVPGGGNYLYRVVRTSDNSEAVLFRFDRQTGQHENLGSLGDLGSNNVFGAVYADAAGYLYASNNGSGDIFRIDVHNVTATLFTDGPDSNNNDGARCANAPILLDFGDAPDDSYGTLLGSGGPRHSLPDYDPNSNSTSLMLGSEVDPEDEGQPSPNADEDSFDDGVTDPIHHIAGEETDVTVTVTNNTGEEATLAGWIDLDGNGTFDPGELQTLNIPASPAGTADYVLTFPPGTTTDDTFARFRVFPGDVPDPEPTGSASAGEVEDYLVLSGRVHYEKTIDPDNVPALEPGDPFTYTVTVTNTGSIPLTGLSFTDDLSEVIDDATYETGSETADIGTVVFNSPEVEWNGDLDVGQMATIMYTVEINDPISGNGTLTNGLIGDGPGSNCTTSPATDPDCFKEVPQPLISGEKTSNATGPAEPGDEITYTFTITNIGSAPIDNASATDDVSDVLDDADYNNNASSGGSGTVTFDESAQELRWTGPLLPGEAVDITYTMTVKEAGELGNGVLRNALLVPNCPNPPIFDDTDSDFDENCVVIIPVNSPVNITKELTAEDGEEDGIAEPGEELTYTITLINSGGTEVTNFDVIDEMDPNVVFVSADNGGGHNGSATGGEIEWTGLTVPENDVLELTVVVEVVDPIPAGVSEISNVAYNPADGPPDCSANPTPSNCTSIPPPTQLEVEFDVDECWRTLSSPVAGLTYADFLEDFYTKGFPGSDDPTDPFPNVYTWPVGATGTDVSDWEPLGNLTDPVVAGQGFIFSVIDHDDTGFPKALSVSGTPHSAPVAAPLNTNDEGWSLVGNPFDVPVSFGGLTKTDLTNVAYVYDRNGGGTTGSNAGRWRTTDGTAGDIDEGKIAAFQGFFVQNAGANPSLSFTEVSKTTGGEFYGKEQEDTQQKNVVRLELQGEGLINSAWVTFSGNGSHERIPGDAWELTPFSEHYALLATGKGPQDMLDIAHFPLTEEAYEVPVHVQTTLPGEYTLHASDLDIPADLQAVFVDRESGIEIPLDEFFTYEFTLEQAAASPDQMAKSSPGGPSCRMEVASLIEQVSPQAAKAAGEGPRFVLRIGSGGAGQEIPAEVGLGQNYPNPFNPTTQITYQLPEAAEVNLEVYDMLGRRVARLVSGTVQAGSHTVSFDASGLSSGIYMYRLQTGGAVMSRKLTVIK